MQLRNSMDKIGGLLNTTFYILSVIYFVITAVFFMNMSAGGGDELLFLKDLDLITHKGWYFAIEKNISIPYMILVYPLTLIFEPVVALRIVNLFILLLLFYYFHRKNLLSNSWPFLLFYVSTAGLFFYGSNDALFYTSMVVFFTETYLAATRRPFSLNLAFIAIIICFFTRQLIVVYLPVIIIAFYILYNKSGTFNKRIWISGVLFIFLLTLNLPSLLKNGELSYDKKLSPEKEVTWTQLQYLAQIMVNEGELSNFRHPTLEQTKNYLEEHGKQSLPDNLIKSLTHDPKFTIKEFFKDFYYILIYSSRGVGLILVISIGHFLINFYSEKKFYPANFIPLISLIVILIFSLIIISFIELRWLCSILIMLIIYYGDLLRNKKIDKRVELVNLIYFCFVAFYGIFRVLPKII